MMPMRSEPKFGYGFELSLDKLALQLQAKAIQKPEELWQAAPNPSPLDTLHLFFPGDFCRYIPIDITRTDDEEI